MDTCLMQVNESHALVTEVISMIRGGFGEPLTAEGARAVNEINARTAARLSVQGQSAANFHHHYDEEEVQAANDYPAELDGVQPNSKQESPGPTCSTIHRRRTRRRQNSVFDSDSSVRNRLFRLEEQRLDCDRQRNVELAGIKMAVLELCSLVRVLLDELHARNN